MKKFLVIIFILVASNTVFSQDVVIVDTPNCGVDFNTYYKFLNSDSTFYNIEINLTSLPSPFEKSFFIYLVNRNKVIRSTDSDLSKEKIIVISNNYLSLGFVTKQLNEIICKTIYANQNFTQEEKQNWINKNTKK
jgi:hypothetical protein